MFTLCVVRTKSVVCITVAFVCLAGGTTISIGRTLNFTIRQARIVDSAGEVCGLGPRIVFAMGRYGKPRQAIQWAFGVSNMVDTPYRDCICVNFT